MQKPSMRKLWFEHVEKTRKKLLRTDKTTTHRSAMKAASVTWPQQKVKIQNKLKREARKIEKVRKVSEATEPASHNT